MLHSTEPLLIFIGNWLDSIRLHCRIRSNRPVSNEFSATILHRSEESQKSDQDTQKSTCNHASVLTDLHRFHTKSYSAGEIPASCIFQTDRPAGLSIQKTAYVPGFSQKTVHINNPTTQILGDRPLWFPYISGDGIIIPLVVLMRTHFTRYFRKAEKARICQCRKHCHHFLMVCHYFALLS